MLWLIIHVKLSTSKIVLISIEVKVDKLNIVTNILAWSLTPTGHTTIRSLRISTCVECASVL